LPLLCLLSITASFLAASPSALHPLRPGVVISNLLPLLASFYLAASASAASPPFPSHISLATSPSQLLHCYLSFTVSSFLTASRSPLLYRSPSQAAYALLHLSCSICFIA
jgi:hypothetical protein